MSASSPPAAPPNAPVAPEAVPTISVKRRATVGSSVEEEMFSRSRSLLQEAGHARVREAHVTVVGLGGVGSHCCAMLARSGVRRLTLIDFDEVTLSSLNRSALAVLSDVGSPKVEAMRTHILEFSPAAEIATLKVLLLESNVAELISSSTDYVVDCIDDLKTKTALLSHCLRSGLTVASSMSAGARIDPSHIHQGKIDQARGDGLAVPLRAALSKRGVDFHSLDVVYSSETPVVALLPLDEKAENDAPQARGAHKYMRRRVVPVVGPVPAAFGVTLAAMVLSRLAGIETSPSSSPSLSRDYLLKMQHRTLQRERKLYGTDASRHIDIFLVDHCITDVFHERCAVTGALIGDVKMIITRWDSGLPLSRTNMVLMTQKAADEHARHGMERWPEATRRRIESTLLGRPVKEPEWFEFDGEPDAGA